MLKLTPETWKLIKDINQRWNDRITYMSDAEHYHEADYWTFPHDLLGDCEEYTIAKRQDLLEYDIESKFVTCWVESGEYHAVLIVTTDYGDFVLDNRYDNIKHFEDLPYTWDKIEGEYNKWFDIYQY